jgi:hypothetical protein
MSDFSFDVKIPVFSLSDRAEGLFMAKNGG